MRALVKRAKNKWGDKKDIRGTITTRDILEFTAVRNMASALQEASNALSNIQNNGGYTREKAEMKFEEIINNPERKLAQGQKEALEKGKQVILDSIDDFNRWKRDHPNEDIYPLLGERFSDVDKKHFRLDTNRFPGAVVLEITDPDSYQSVTGKELTLGFYNKSLGTGLSF